MIFWAIFNFWHPPPCELKGRNCENITLAILRTKYVPLKCGILSMLHETCYSKTSCTWKRLWSSSEFVRLMSFSLVRVPGSMSIYFIPVHVLFYRQLVYLTMYGSKGTLYFYMGVSDKILNLSTRSQHCHKLGHLATPMLRL